MPDAVELAVTIAFFVFSLVLLLVGIYQLFVERKLKLHISDGSLKYLLRRVATISALLLVIDRCFSLGMLGGTTGGASRVRILFEAGIFVGIFVALEIYAHHSITALCMVTMKAVPPIYNQILVFIVAGTCASFLLLTIIGIGINRIFPIYIYFYIQMSLLLVLNISSVYVINKISTIMAQAARDAKVVESAVVLRNNKLFRKTKIFLFIWWLLWFVAVLFLVYKASTLFQDLGKPIDFGGSDTATVGAIVAYFLMIVPWIGAIWYTWIPQAKPTSVETSDTVKRLSKEKSKYGSSGSLSGLQNV